MKHRYVCEPFQNAHQKLMVAQFAPNSTLQRDAASRPQDRGFFARLLVQSLCHQSVAARLNVGRWAVLNQKPSFIPYQRHMLSSELQHTIQLILARISADETDRIDAADILDITSLFGSLNAVQLRLTPHHQRRLLLQLLTLHHLVPIWDFYLPTDQRLHHSLQTMLSLVLKRLSPDHALQARNQLWSDIALYPRQPVPIEHLSISVYTTLKVVDLIENPLSTVDDYAPDTHAGVALWCAGQAYGAHQSAKSVQQENHYVRQFWQYWLTEIIPRA